MPLSTLNYQISYRSGITAFFKTKCMNMFLLKMISVNKRIYVFLICHIAQAVEAATVTQPTLGLLTKVIGIGFVIFMY